MNQASCPCKRTNCPGMGTATPAGHIIRHPNAGVPAKRNRKRRHKLFTG